MSVEERLSHALEAARVWHGQLPAAADFVSWPDDLAWASRASHRLAAADQIRSAPGAVSDTSAPLLSALQAIAEDVEWRHTYTVDEVGQHFLDHYGWFELAGPEGHFHTRETRITVGYWGPELYYPWHQHEPEELYTVVSGSAVFATEGEVDATLGAGGTRLHLSNQPHALTTEDHPVLTLVFWRGERLADPPRLSPEAAP